MTVLVGIILTMMVLYGGFTVGRLIGIKKLSKLLLETGRLSAENTKLADLVLALKDERLLLAEDMPEIGEPKALGPAHPEALVVVRVEPSGIDRLLDLMRTLPLTRVETRSHEGYDDAGLDGLVIYHFGDLAIRDAANRFKNWSPDLLYRGAWVGVLKEEQMVRAREIIDHRIADAVAWAEDKERAEETSPFLRMMARADRLLEEAGKPPDHSWRKHPDLCCGRANDSRAGWPEKGGEMTAVAGVFLVVCFFLGTLVPLMLLNGWALSVMWGWFLVPLGLPPIGMAMAIGIGSIIGLLQHTPAAKPLKKGKELEDWLNRLGNAVLKVGVVLLVGWIAHKCM